MKKTNIYSGNPIIELDSIEKKVFSRSLPILDKISLKIWPNTRYIVTGTSGSGKSSLLYMVALLDLPTHGIIRYNGQDISLLDKPSIATIRNKEIGLVFQSPFLLPQFNVMENILLPTKIRDNAEVGVKEWLSELVATLDIEHLMEEKIDHLSGGEMQRVSIARSLINKPNIILADEPTSQLDTHSSDKIFQLLDEIHNRYGTTIVLVTHRNGIWSSSDVIIEMDDGKCSIREGVIV